MNSTTKVFLTFVLVGHFAPLCAAEHPKLRLKDQSNFRDLGGYLTAEGQRVKFGVVFRSGELSRLTDADVRKLKTLGIKTVVNFLTDEEIKARGKDRLPENVNSLELPIAGGDADGRGPAGAILEARQRADFSKVPVELNPEIHRRLVREAQKQYAALLRELAKSDQRPLVFHCSHGVLPRLLCRGGGRLPQEGARPRGDTARRGDPWPGINWRYGGRATDPVADSEYRDHHCAGRGRSTARGVPVCVGNCSKCGAAL